MWHDKLYDAATDYVGNVNYDDAKISYILSVIGNITFLGYCSFIFIFYLAEFIHDKCLFQNTFRD